MMKTGLDLDKTGAIGDTAEMSIYRKRLQLTTLWI